MLQKLIKHLPWWRGFGKKKIWRSRIQWLDRIREPRLWLLYLMARRRRILQQATVTVMVKLREKTLLRSTEFIPMQPISIASSQESPNPISLQAMEMTATASAEHGPSLCSASVAHEHLNPTQHLAQELREYKERLQKRFGARSLEEVLATYLTNSEQESLAHMPVPGGGLDGANDNKAEHFNYKKPQVVVEQLDGLVLSHMNSLTFQTTTNKARRSLEEHDKGQFSPRSRLSSTARELRSTLRSSISRSRQRGYSHSSDQVPRIQGRCPIFNMRFEATRKDIKQQVEALMPKPKPYIVIGWFHRSTSDPTEKILQFENPEMLLNSLRDGIAEVRGWRRFSSLKTLKGFGLYKVSRAKGCNVQ
jgi:hypothetical protein